MASWIFHLRVGDRVFEQLFDILPHEFIVGNIAPDCGVPNEDWSAFTPSKEISHFKTDAGDFEQADELKKAKEFRNSYMEEFDESAFADRIKYIVEFYESSVRNLDREYPYLNGKEADRFVEETVAYLLSDDILGKFTVTRDYMSHSPEEKKHIDREPLS